jgi:hypothetical protein
MIPPNLFQAFFELPDGICMYQCVTPVRPFSAGSPKNLRVRFAVEEGDCVRVMRVATRFVSEHHEVFA